MTELDKAIKLLEQASTTKSIGVTSSLHSVGLHHMMIREALLRLYKHRNEGVLNANRAYCRGREDEKNKVGGMQI